MKAYKAFFGAAVTMGVLSLLVGCDDPTGPDTITGPQVSLQIIPGSMEIGVGEVKQFTVTVNGVRPTQMAQVRWSSSDPEKAWVDGDGRVRGLEPGAVAIIAEYRDGRSTAQLQVRRLPADGGDGDGKGEPDLPDIGEDDRRRGGHDAHQPIE